MISLKTITRAALATTLLTAPFAMAANVTSDYNHDINFRSYHTFSFFKVQTADPFLNRRLEQEMTADLSQAGYTRVPSGGDINITIFEGEHNQKEYNTFYDGMGGLGYGWGGWGGWWGGGWGRPGMESTTVQNIPVGTLMVDMYDANTRQLIWRGRASTQLSNNAGKNTKKFDKDIDHMLNGFPPKTQG